MDEVRRQVEAGEGEGDRGVNLAAGLLRVLEALQVQDEHLGRAPQIQLLAGLHIQM